MYFYQFHVGDYLSHTHHLSPMEDLAYRKMLDHAYLHERGLEGDAASVARAIGLRDQVEAVASVLSEFWSEDDGVWRNKRVEAELAKMADRRAQASAAGKASASKRTTVQRPFNDRSTGAEHPSNDRPTSQEPIPVPQPQYPRANPIPPHENGEGSASLESGDGERGGAQERQAVFALLGATTLRSKAKNRRQILAEIAGAVVADGMGSDQARRLIAKAKAETKGDYGALLGEWFQPVAWREKWDEIVSGGIRGIVAGVAAGRRRT